MKYTLQLLVLITISIICIGQTRVRKANDGPSRPVTNRPPERKEYLDLNNTKPSAPINTQRAFTFTTQATAPNGVSDLWAKMSLVDQNLNILLKQPNNDILYEQTKRMLLDCQQFIAALGNASKGEVDKATDYMRTLVEKAIEVDRLRGLKTSNNFNTVQTNNQAQELVSGFIGGVQQNEGRNDKLNKDINDLERDKDESTNELQAKQKSVFSKLLDKEKSKSKLPFQAPAGNGYTRVLFDDSLVRVTYYLSKIEHRDCEYEHVGGSRVVATDNGSKVELNTNLVMFRGYYYKAVCEIINKRNLKLVIKGGIRGAWKMEAQEHILPIGNIAKCFGFDKKDTYWDKFYYAWDMILTNPTFKSEGTFWTEIADEEPSFGITYTILE